MRRADVDGRSDSHTGNNRLQYAYEIAEFARRLQGWAMFEVTQFVQFITRSVSKR